MFPFSTLGWPDKTVDMEAFFDTIKITLLAYQLYKEMVPIKIIRAVEGLLLLILRMRLIHYLSPKSTYWSTPEATELHAMWWLHWNQQNLLKLL